MRDRIRVCILTGTIPATPFIEILIDALRNSGLIIFLVGKRLSVDVASDSSLQRVYLSRSAAGKVMSIAYYGLKLLFFNPRVWFRLLSTIRRSRFKKGKLLTRAAELLTVASLKPDILHLQWVASIENWVILKQLLHCRLVVSLRGTQLLVNPIVDERIRESYKECFGYVDAFHAVSKAVADEAQKYGVPANSVHVIYSAVSRRTLGLWAGPTRRHQGRTLNVLSVGRFNWIKGYHYALDAIAALVRKGIQVQYTIVGRNASEEIRFQIRDLALGEIVTIYNEMPQQKIFSLMQEADMLLVPSVTEGLANVALEAMAVGLPVVTSDCGGMSELIVNRRNGFIFPNRDVEAMQNAIMECSSLTVEELNCLVTNAKETVETRFVPEILKERMVGLYKEILA